MSHSALFPAYAAPVPATGWSPAGRSGWKPLGPAKRLFRRFHRWMDSGYRPERHYMRGGRTPGAKSLAAP